MRGLKCGVGRWDARGFVGLLCTFMNGRDLGALGPWTGGNMQPPLAHGGTPMRPAANQTVRGAMNGVALTLEGLRVGDGSFGCLG
jgi:hypothetical protein